MICSNRRNLVARILDTKCRSRATAVSAEGLSLCNRRGTEFTLSQQQPGAACFADVGARNGCRIAFRTIFGSDERLAAFRAESSRRNVVLAAGSTHPFVGVVGGGFCFSSQTRSNCRFVPNNFAFVCHVRHPFGEAFLYRAPRCHMPQQELKLHWCENQVHAWIG